MAIDELKLKEDVKEYYSTLKPQYISKLVEAVVEDIIDIIDDQPKLSLENKTSDKWIPCSERLPEVWESVLVTSGHLRVRDIRIAFVNENMEWASIWSSCEPDILAWMPLPEVYKGEEK